MGHVGGRGGDSDRKLNLSRSQSHLRIFGLEVWRFARRGGTPPYTPSQDGPKFRNLDIGLGLSLRDTTETLIPSQAPTPDPMIPATIVRWSFTRISVEP